MANPLDIAYCVLRFGFFFVTNCYGLFSYVMWTTVLFPLRFLWPSVYWKLESFIFKGLQSFVILWMDPRHYGIIESGDDIRRLSEKQVVLLCNHQSTADTPLVILSMWPKGMCMANSMWIMDWIFRYTNFGLVSTIRRDFFIRQGKETRELQGKWLTEHLEQFFIAQGRKWIILFPEGGFLRNRLETSQNYARKNGYPVLKNVTLPRIGALKTLTDFLGTTEEPSGDDSNGNIPNLDEIDPEQQQTWVVDMTIGYRNSEGCPPDMLGMCLGYRVSQDMHVHYRAYPLACIPRDTDNLLKWMYDRYEEKELLLEYFNSHGHFPQGGSDEQRGALPSLSSRRVTYDWIHVVLYQAFYLISSYLHYTCIIRPLCSLFF